MAGFTLRIYASDTMQDYDTNSLVDLSALPAYTNENWETYEILGLEAFPIDYDEPEKTAMGGIIRSKRNLWTFNVVFMPLYTLQNHIRYITLANQLRKNFKCFVVEGYDSAITALFCPTGKAVAFELSGKIERPEADYEKGKKSLTLEFRKVELNA